MRISIVIPMYNEEKTAPDSLTLLLGFLEKNLNKGDYEVIAVNDGSTDGTEKAVSALAEASPFLHLVSYPVNRGKGGAVKAGIARAKGDFVLFTDCDLAYGPETIIEFLKCYEEGDTDVLLGSRAIHPEGYENYTPFRRFASKSYLALVRVYAGFSYSDSQCGIKGFSSSAARRLFEDLYTEGFAFDLEILLRAGDLRLRVRELPVKIAVHASSSVHPLKDAFRMLSDLRKIKKRRKTASQKGVSDK